MLQFQFSFGVGIFSVAFLATDQTFCTVPVLSGVIHCVQCLGPWIRLLVVSEEVFPEVCISFSCLILLLFYLFALDIFREVDWVMGTHVSGAPHPVHTWDPALPRPVKDAGLLSLSWLDVSLACSIDCSRLEIRKEHLVKRTHGTAWYRMVSHGTCSFAKTNIEVLNPKRIQDKGL